LLLFSEQREGPWNSTGSNNFKEICRALQKHGISKDHTHALLKFRLFRRKQQNIANVLDNAHRQSVTEFNHRKSGKTRASVQSAKPLDTGHGTPSAKPETPEHEQCK
jgi:hypothetical protein